MTRDEAAALKSNMHATFESPQGKEVMRFIEKIGTWIPSIYDSMDTNAIVSRDANRRLIGTLKTIIELSPDQIVTLTEGE